MGLHFPNLFGHDALYLRKDTPLPNVSAPVAPNLKKKTKGFKESLQAQRLRIKRKKKKKSC